MVLRPEPLAAAIEAVEAARGPTHRILLSPQGRPFDQADRGRALVQRPRILLICGRYEGFDERVAELFAHDVLSIGDFVLSGGEVAAAVVIEAVSRLVPGVHRQERVDRRRVLLRPAGWSTRTTPAPPSSAGSRCPRCCVSGDHARDRGLAPARSAAPHPRAPARPAGDATP